MRTPKVIIHRLDKTPYRSTTGKRLSLGRGLVWALSSIAATVLMFNLTTTADADESVQTAKPKTLPTARIASLSR